MVRFSPGDLEIREIGADGSQAVGVIERLREADSFLAVGDPLLEFSRHLERNIRKGLGDDLGGVSRHWRNGSVNVNVDPAPI